VKHSPRQDAGELAPGHGRLSTHEDLDHPFGELMGLGESGGTIQETEIEDRNVRVGTGA
jgi:hypothetical protein